MRIVIEIPEVIYESCKKEYKALANGEIVDSYTYAIATGTPLPKGHGRLIDADELGLHGVWQMKILLGQNGKCVEERVYNQNDIDNAQTIIEADREESE